MNHSIVNFLDCPEVLPRVAGWIYQEFWSGKPGYSADAMLQRISHGRRDTLPIGLVALQGSEPVGTVSLIESDMEERSDLAPWLATLYVVPDARGRGIGASLVSSCVEAASRCGFPSLYLQTSILKHCTRFGWYEIAEIPERNVVILKCDVAN